MDESKKDGKSKILFWIAFIAIGILAYNNYTLKQELHYYMEKSDEFHSNLYAQTLSTSPSGAHTLSISDVYYRKYFKSEDKE